MSATRDRRAAGRRLEAAINSARDGRARLADAWARVPRAHLPPGSRGRRLAPARALLGHRRRPGRLLAGRHPGRLLAAVLAGLLMVLGCLWLWFRDSPFVSVSRVQIVGLSGPQVPQIEQALRAAAVRMTTLDINLGQLRTAVEPYPDVRSLTVRTSFPHGVVIHVREQVPIAQLRVDGRSLAISRDGTLLQATPAAARLPTLPVPVPPAGTRLTEAGPRLALTVLAAAPYRFLAHIAGARQTPRYGVVVQLRHGPQLRFGDTSQLAAKWAAALAVLGSASSHGAQYIDVSDPGRPAAGAPTGASGAASSGSGSTAGSGTPALSGSATPTSTGSTGSTSTSGATSTPVLPTTQGATSATPGTG